MFKKLLLAAAFVATPLALSETASADHNRCYRGYRGPAVTYRAPHPHHYHSRHYGYPVYRSYYGRGYGYGYPGMYGYGYGGLGYPYYQRGTSIGYGRGGFSLRIGF